MENERVRKLVTEHPKLVVMYTSSSCDFCLRLAPKLAKIMQEEKYKDFYFVEIDSKEHHVAQQTVETHKAPLIILCDNGLVIESKTVKSEADFRSLFKNCIK